MHGSIRLCPPLPRSLYRICKSGVSLAALLYYVYVHLLLLLPGYIQPVHIYYRVHSFIFS